jgi:hypothetical protein
MIEQFLRKYLIIAIISDAFLQAAALTGDKLVLEYVV